MTKESGFDSGHPQEIFTFCTASTPPMRHNHPSIQWVYPQWQSDRRVKLTTHLHVVPNLWIN